MFAKLLFLIVIATASGTALLGLRQRQLEISHENATLHRRINHSRQSLWWMQARIAEGIDPEALRRAVSEAQLELEPVVTGEVPPEGHHTLVTVPAAYRP